MEEEFFNIDFNDASSLGILDLPNNEPPADETKDKTDETNKVVTDAPQEEEATEEVDNKREENSTEVNVEGSPNISSSIALALAENGVLQTLDKERLEKVVTTENLIEAFREELKNRLSSELTEQQKRVLDALDNGVEKDEILYVGNDYITDVIGATSVGLKTVWYNVNHLPNQKGLNIFEIDSFRQLLSITQR